MATFLFTNDEVVTIFRKNSIDVIKKSFDYDQLLVWVCNYRGWDFYNPPVGMDVMASVDQMHAEINAAVIKDSFENESLILESEEILPGISVHLRRLQYGGIRILLYENGIAVWQNTINPAYTDNDLYDIGRLDSGFASNGDKYISFTIDEELHANNDRCVHVAIRISARGTIHQYAFQDWDTPKEFYIFDNISEQFITLNAFADGLEEVDATMLHSLPVSQSMIVELSRLHNGYLRLFVKHKDKVIFGLRLSPVKVADSYSISNVDSSLTEKGDQCISVLVIASSNKTPICASSLSMIVNNDGVSRDHYNFGWFKHPKVPCMVYNEYKKDFMLKYLKF